MRTFFKRAFRYLVRFAACIGFLHILITVTPILPNWTTLLSTNWGAADGDTLVVLGSDTISPAVMGLTSYWRAFYANLVWHDGHFRRLVISGKDAAPAMADFLVFHGVARDAITIDNESDSTRQNALNVSTLLRSDASARRGRIVLITSDYHMRRALGAMRKTGIDASPLPYPDAFKRINTYSERWAVLCALSVETVKTAYYRFKGWT